MLVGVEPRARILTIDTGRLPQETYDTIESTMLRYGIRYEVVFPDAMEIDRLTAEHGPNSFRTSVECRKLCCLKRKVEPLRRKLADAAVWICGLRQEQGGERTRVETVAWDNVFGLVKINPLANWTERQVWEYIHDNNVPYNALHDKGLRSIGCAPCVRATLPGESERAGRWWWEPEHKECGLHWVDGKLVGPAKCLTPETVAVSLNTESAAADFRFAPPLNTEP